MTLICRKWRRSTQFTQRSQHFSEIQNIRFHSIHAFPSYTQFNSHSTPLCSHRPIFSFQDSYALCRVFKKNGPCTEVEEPGQCSISFLVSSSSVIINDYETMSLDMPVASSSCMDEDGKDDARMQFITDDAIHIQLLN